MPDITMCRADCPSSAKCRRHPDSGTKPSKYQWWAGFAPDTDRCGDFWPTAIEAGEHKEPTT